MTPPVFSLPRTTGKFTVYIDACDRHVVFYFIQEQLYLSYLILLEDFITSRKLLRHHTTGHPSCHQFLSQIFKSHNWHISGAQWLILITSAVHASMNHRKIQFTFFDVTGQHNSIMILSSWTSAEVNRLSARFFCQFISIRGLQRSIFCESILTSTPESLCKWRITTASTRYTWKLYRYLFFHRLSTSVLTTTVLSKGAPFKYKPPTLRSQHQYRQVSSIRRILLRKVGLWSLYSWLSQFLHVFQVFVPLDM